MNSPTDVEHWIGIDVSQAWLDVAARPSGDIWREPNTLVGWEALAQRLSGLQVALIVVESTGGMERNVVEHLQRAEFAVAVINPKRARDFAKASGRLAKTDRIDAQGLAHFAEALRPLPKPLAAEAQQARARSSQPSSAGRRDDEQRAAATAQRTESNGEVRY